MMKFAITGFILIFLAAAAPCVYPQEGRIALEDIVVTAKRIEEPLKDTTANITVITEEDIESMGAVTLIDVFREEPNVFVGNQLNNPKYSSVDIRGYGESAASNVLILIDGRRVNNIDISGADIAQIPVNIVERVEVYRGSASVMFGDNACAGAINIILKKGEGKMKMKSSLIVGSDNLANPAVSAWGKEKNISYFFNASYYDTDGYRSNNGLLMKDLFGNVVMDLSKYLTVSIKSGYHKDRYGMPGPILWQDLSSGIHDRKDSITPYDYATTEDSFVDINSDIKVSEKIMLALGGSMRQRNTFFNFDYTPNGYTQSKGKYTTYGFTPKLTIDQPLFDKKNIFLCGFDYYKNPFDLDTDGLFIYDSSVFPSQSSVDIEKSDYGYYFIDKFYLAPNLLLDLGYRHHRASYRFDYVDGITPALSQSFRESYRREAWRASVNYEFTKNGNIFFTYARGFRFPVADELVNLQYGTINSDLKPQDTEEYDIGIRWYPWTFAGGSITLFRTVTNDEIYYNPLTYTNGNYDRTLRQGLEATLNFTATDNLKFDVFYSYVKPVFDGGQYSGNDIPFVSRNKLGARVQYSFQPFVFNLLAVYTGNRYAISDQDNNNRKLPGYTTLDANIIYRFKNFTAQLGVKNLTGTKYSEYGVASAISERVNLYPSPERQFFLKLEYLFGN